MSAHGPSLLPCVPRGHLSFSPLDPGFSSDLNFESAMSDDPGVQFVGARSTKRSSRQMSRQSSEENQTPWQSHFHPLPSHPREDSRPPPLPPMRHFRDEHEAIPGTTRSAAPDGGVIDLTVDPDTPPRRTGLHGPESSSSNSGRLPRFGRNIMADVVDLAQESDDPVEALSSSPEVQFVGATIRPPPQRWADLRASHEQHRSRANRIQPFDRGHGRILPSIPSSRSNHARAEMERFILGDDPLNFSLPYGLNYDSVSFSMDPVLPSIQLPHQPEPRRREVYNAPSPPPEGFTRTLQEDDVAVCPNCSWELGTGDGKKQEIWVAKPCGHVYCGECTENRSKSKLKKTNAPSKTKAFHKCQVVDCGKTVSAPTAMFHLYL